MRASMPAARRSPSASTRGRHWCLRSSAVARLSSSTTNGCPVQAWGWSVCAERVALAGGSLEHGEDPAGRFVVRATLPWAP